ncbi:MAG: type III pantothenate kinase [Bacteroidota bacterium]
MRNLVIDIGNSRVKYGVFLDGELQLESRLEQWSASDILALATNHHPENIIYSTVGQELPDEAERELSESYPLFELDQKLPLPFVNAYETPATLGKDRLAAAAGAQYWYPGKHCLIVDAGTCITLDLLRSDAVYLGGNIAPGVRMRLRAMHEQTARLPLVEPKGTPKIWGTTTETALQNGAGLGAALEIEALATRLQQRWTDLQVVLTGGDAAFLANSLECKIFVHSNLVLWGLNKILTYNVEKLA